MPTHFKIITFCVEATDINVQITPGDLLFTPIEKMAARYLLSNYIPNWYGRPNPEGQINRKPDG